MYTERNFRAQYKSNELVPAPGPGGNNTGLEVTR
jgi:hypothetical protein